MLGDVVCAEGKVVRKVILISVYLNPALPPVWAQRVKGGGRNRGPTAGLARSGAARSEELAGTTLRPKWDYSADGATDRPPDSSRSRAAADSKPARPVQHMTRCRFTSSTRFRNRKYCSIDSTATIRGNRNSPSS